MPVSAEITDLVAEKPRIGVSMPIAVGIALGDDAAVLQDHDRPVWRSGDLLRLGKGAVERGSQLRRLRRDDGGAGDVRQ